MSTLHYPEAGTRSRLGVEIAFEEIYKAGNSDMRFCWKYTYPIRFVNGNSGIGVAIVR